MGGTRLIWINALYIPIEPISRHKAMEMMNGTYKDAAAVVVPDAGLQSLDITRASSAMEI